MKPVLSSPLTVQTGRRADFACTRKDIAAILPKHCGKVLELGCGVGGTLVWLKKNGHAHSITGVELCRHTVSIASTGLDHLLQGDLEQSLQQLQDEKFDLILCLDGLTHFADPAATLHALHGLMRPGGNLIISVVKPVSCLAVTKMLAQSGFVVKQQRDNDTQAGVLHAIWQFVFARTPLRNVFVSQFLLRAKKPRAALHDSGKSAK